MTKDRRLGRGLAALLGNPMDESDGAPGAFVEEESTAYVSAMHSQSETPRTALDALAPHVNDEDGQSEPANASDAGLLLLNIQEIETNPFQPRRDFNPEEIASLSASLKEHDMLQPILVRRVNDRFQLISGERRLRAAIEAGWTQIPARLREADDRLVAELAIVENLQRKDLNPIEKALSFKRYLDEHQCPQDELAKRLKIDRSTIANLMRLLELPDPVRDAVQVGSVTAGHARALLPLGDEKLQLEFARRIQDEGLSVREVERQVQERIREEDGEPFPAIAGSIGKTAKVKNTQVESLEQKLRMVLGTKVDIRQSARGRGKITIHFGNHDEFDRIWHYLTDEGFATERTA